MQNSQILYNAPVPVYFAGFESTTLALQSQGWDFSMERSFERMSFRLAMRHEGAGLQAISSHVEFDFLSRNEIDWYRRFPGFRIVWMGSKAQFHVMPEMRAMKFEAYDAIPQFHSYERISFEDAIPFKTMRNDESKEIVIAQENVEELLEKIIKMQDPKQAEIRKRKRDEAKRYQNATMENVRPLSNVLASVITIAS